MLCDPESCLSKKILHCLLAEAGGVCDEAADNVRAALMEGVSLCPGKTAILSRCNVTVFGEAVRLTDSNPQCRLHFIGVSLH